MILARVAAAWLAGIAAASMLGRGAWPLALAIVATMVAYALIRRDRREVVYALLLPLIFAVALLRFETSRQHLAGDAVARYNDGVAMRIRGVLRDDPDIRDTTQRFAIEAREVQERGEWQPASGGVQVTSGLYPRYQSGDVVELEGVLATPQGDGTFDYADYLAQRGIASTVGFPSLRVVGHEDDGLIRSTVLHVRRSLSDALTLALPEPQASLAQSVLLGERSALPPDLANDLNATNTSHLVVVSGSNIVLVSAFATLLFAWLVGRRRAMMLSIAAVLAYATLVGFSAPVMRATIMGVLLIVAQLNGRPASSLTSILFAAAIMVGVNPSAARDISFQLSFAATAGIVFLSSPIRAWTLEWTARALRRDTLPRAFDAWLVEPLAMTLAAIIATEPLIALNFGRVSLVAIPANMLVVPAFGIILLSSLVAAIGGLIPHLHLVLAAPAYYALTYWIVLAHRLASIPHAYSTFGGFSAPWATTAYAAITVLAFGLLQRLGRPLAPRVAPSRAITVRRLAPIAAIAVPAAVLVASAGFVVWPSSPSRLRVTILDVGQGDATLIQTPDGHDILVDGGPGPAVLRALGDELSWRDRSIDVIVMTHPQADHMYGLIDVLDRYDVHRVLAGPGLQPSAGYDAFARAAAYEGRTIDTAKQGMSFDLGDGVRLDVLAPDPVEAMDSQLNNTGAVIMISWGDVRFLLTADIEARAEAALVANTTDLHATLLKVPHHGSRTSSSPLLLSAVQPSISVVSSGKDNQFGHPAPDVVDRLDDHGVVYNTADAGSVHIETDGEHVWVSTER